MNENIKIGGDIHAGDGGYSLGTQEKYDEFVKGRNQSLGKARIKELMSEAGTDTSGKWMGIEHAEKFAELIIRDCMEVISDGRFSDSECEGNSHRISYNNGRYDASLDIKKHFGVEE